MSKTFETLTEEGIDVQMAEWKSKNKITKLDPGYASGWNLNVMEAKPLWNVATSAKPAKRAKK